MAKSLQTDKKPLLDINSDDFSDDPEIPYSGGSSAAFVNDELNKPAEEEKKKQRQQRSDLLPVAKDIFTFLNEETAALADIRAYIHTLGEKPNAEELIAEYRARELYVNYLKRFELWMVNRLSKTPANQLKR